MDACTGSLCYINRAKHVFDKSTLAVFVNALIFSKLYYCSSIWSYTSKKNIVKLPLREYLMAFKFISYLAPPYLCTKFF